MPKSSYTKAFAEYGATLANTRWSISAVTPQNELVISLWEHAFQAGGLYQDSLDRWKGNKPGQHELAENLKTALEEKLPVLAVFVKLKDKADQDALANGRMTGDMARKEIYARPDLIGKVESFDGNRFVLKFVNRVF